MESILSASLAIAYERRTCALNCLLVAAVALAVVAFTLFPYPFCIQTFHGTHTRAKLTESRKWRRPKIVCVGTRHTWDGLTRANFSISSTQTHSRSTQHTINYWSLETKLFARWPTPSIPRKVSNCLISFEPNEWPPSTLFAGWKI